MYVKSGSGKSRGIGVTQYKESVFYAGKKYYINQTEMEFHGAVNIKIERGNQNRSENYGVFGSNTTKKRMESANRKVLITKSIFIVM